MFYSHDFEVYYSDVDKDNRLKVCSLFNIFQEMGCMHSDYAGYGLKDIPNTHVAWLVTNWKAQIIRYPSWNEKIHVVTWSRHEDSIYAYRDFEVLDENNNMIAKCSSKWVLVNTETGRLEKLSSTIADSFEPESKQVFNNPIDRLKEPTNSTTVFSYKVLRRDIDTNKHMNNNNYLQIALEALPENNVSAPISFVEIMYKHPAMLGDTISCLYYKNKENEQIITLKSEDLSKLFAIVKLS